MSRTSSGVVALDTQIIIVSPAARSSGLKIESRWSPQVAHEQPQRFHGCT
jgi:hypothetical protein